MILMCAQVRYTGVLIWTGTHLTVSLPCMLSDDLSAADRVLEDESPTAR